jgi:uncharacterized protein YqeY
MSALKDRLRTDLTAAIKGRDEVRSSTLRMVPTAITNAGVAGDGMRAMGTVMGVLSPQVKGRDEIRSSTLRMVLTAITNAEVAGKEQRELTDDDIVGVLSTEAKKRREAAIAFHDGGREEMAAKERAEAAVIADYLPEPLSEADIAALVTEAIERTGAAEEGMRAMGKVMGVVSPQVKGRADGAVVAAEVRRQLG